MTGPLPRGCTYLHILFDNFDTLPTSHDLSGASLLGSSWPQDGRRFGALRTCKTFGVASPVALFQNCFQQFQDVSRCFKFQQIDVCFQNPCRILSPSTSVDRKIQGQLDGWREIPQVRHSLSHTFPHLPSCFM